MDQAVKKFTSEGSDARKWIGRIIIAVILGEAIWSLIVSVMNNLVVPWLGDVMGRSSGLPTSFTQRPYDYPDLFVSILEFCIAGTITELDTRWRNLVNRCKILRYTKQVRPFGTLFKKEVDMRSWKQISLLTLCVLILLASTAGKPAWQMKADYVEACS